MLSQVFGRLSDGRDVISYTWSSPVGIEVSILSLGAIIQSLKVRNADGNQTDVVLGFDTPQEYLDSLHYTGCVVGRYAGRIDQGRFALNDSTFKLSVNHPPHHIHGGFNGLHQKIWDVKVDEDGQGLVMSCFSPDKEEGYPGNIHAFVHYRIEADHQFHIYYYATSDADTILNLTQHSYFNLSSDSSTILKHALRIDADQYLPLRADMIPTGEILNVDKSVFDFRSPKILASVWMEDEEQISLAGGLDHYFIKREMESLEHIATLWDLDSGRTIDVITSAPGIQVYTANGYDAIGKSGQNYGKFSGICLETQGYPDAPNQSYFPIKLTRPGQPYSSETIWIFGHMPAG